MTLSHNIARWSSLAVAINLCSFSLSCNFELLVICSTLVGHSIWFQTSNGSFALLVYDFFQPVGTLIFQFKWVLISLCFNVFLYFVFCSGSIDGNNQLIIKGRFQQKQIENVLRRYISKLCLCFFWISCSRKFIIIWLLS